MQDIPKGLMARVRVTTGVSVAFRLPGDGGGAGGSPLSGPG